MKNSIERKIAKKAWQELRGMKSASNMVFAESLFYTALYKTFGLLHMGIISISMRKGYSNLLAEYGATKYANIESLKAARTKNYEENGMAVVNILLDTIRPKFGETIMFKQLEGRWSDRLPKPF